MTNDMTVGKPAKLILALFNSYACWKYISTVL